MLDPDRPYDVHIDRRLRTEPIIWLASMRPDGWPHLVPLWFLWDGAAILLFSPPDTQKLRNLRANPAVTMSLEAADQGYDIVIIEGRASSVADPLIRGDMPEFVEKYRALPRRWEPAEWAERFSQAIRVEPTRLVAWMTRPGQPARRRVVRF